MGAGSYESRLLTRIAYSSNDTTQCVLSKATLMLEVYVYYHKQLARSLESVRRGAAHHNSYYYSESARKHLPQTKFPLYGTKRGHRSSW